MCVSSIVVVVVKRVITKQLRSGITCYRTEKTVGVESLGIDVKKSVYTAFNIKARLYFILLLKRFSAFLKSSASESLTVSLKL